MTEHSNLRAGSVSLSFGALLPRWTCCSSEPDPGSDLPAVSQNEDLNTETFQSMAEIMKKEFKKSSYYVLFLGAEECIGLRGKELIEPVVKTLVEREKDIEPYTVTLQVSHKGLKIIRNVPSTSAKSSGRGGKQEQLKQFIPQDHITCVYQNNDIVACIVILFIATSKCPLHVQVFRCDTINTADVLRSQLQTLLDLPENQKKLSDLETRLRSKGALPIPKSLIRRQASGSGVGSLDGHSTRGSESSGGSSSERLSAFSGHPERISTLYDSLAAELREKLGDNHGCSETSKYTPILLPPKDYDTVHRHRGNLAAVDSRRCRSTNIVGVNVKSKAGIGGKSAAVGSHRGGIIGSSGGSSGIGSDHAPSPEQDRESDSRFLDHSTSAGKINVYGQDDEDWNDPSEDSLFLVPTGGKQFLPGDWKNSGRDLSLPRARHLRSSGTDSPSSPPRAQNCKYNVRPTEETLRSPSPSSSHENKHSSPDGGVERSDTLSPQDRFRDAKEKFKLLEKERLEEQEKLAHQKNLERKQNSNSQFQCSPPISPTINSSGGSFRNWSRVCDGEEERDKRSLSYHNSRKEHEGKGHTEWYDVRRSRERHAQEKTFYGENTKSHKLITEEPAPSHHSFQDFQVHRRSDPEVYPYYDSMRNDRDSYRQNSGSFQDIQTSEQNVLPKRHVPSERVSIPTRQSGLSPVRQSAPGMRFLPNIPIQGKQNKNFVPDEVSRCQEYHNPPLQYKGHIDSFKQPYYGNDKNIPLERYRSKGKSSAPPLNYNSANNEESECYDPQRFVPENPHAMSGHMKPVDVHIKKQSKFEALEDERRRNSYEIAREFKRRACKENGSGEFPTYEAELPHSRDTGSRNFGYYELAENERYPGLDRDTARLGHHHDVEVTPRATRQTPDVSPRYRHSYAEPLLHRPVQPQHYHPHEVLLRTNSSVSSGRVGIASVHPY